MKIYRPHKYQREFHSSKARFRAFIAGRRGGKTTSGTMEALAFAYGESIDRKKKIQTPTHGWIISPTYQMLKDINIPVLMDWCDPEVIKSWNKSDNRL